MCSVGSTDPCVTHTCIQLTFMGLMAGLANTVSRGPKVGLLFIDTPSPKVEP